MTLARRQNARMMKMKSPIASTKKWFNFVNISFYWKHTYTIFNVDKIVIYKQYILNKNTIILTQNNHVWKKICF